MAQPATVRGADAGALSVAGTPGHLSERGQSSQEGETVAGPAGRAPGRAGTEVRAGASRRRSRGAGGGEWFERALQKTHPCTEAVGSTERLRVKDARQYRSSRDAAELAVASRCTSLSAEVVAKIEARLLTP